MKSSLKIFAINILVFFVLINAIIWALCIGNSVKNSLVSTVFQPDRRSELPNYANTDWAQKHFEEFHSMGTKYVSYIGWRRRPLSGTTINVSGTYLQRETVGQTDSEKPTVYFFGGSTMWGLGSNDASTIPSLFTQLSGFPSENFGETGYTSHQSLVLLIQLLQEGRRPDFVVFYDGVNEVAYKCRVELTPESHSREAQISAVLERPKRISLSYLLGPLRALAEKMVDAEVRGDQKKYYNCHNDIRKAQKIADNLSRDWAVAQRLVESFGGKFLGILQPLAFFSDTKLDHIGLKGAPFRDNTFKAQYKAVYPLIEEKIHKKNGFYNFVDLLDRDEYIYIDFCHLSPNGNRYIAEKMVEIIANKLPRALMEPAMN